MSARPLLALLRHARPSCDVGFTPDCVAELDRAADWLSLEPVIPLSHWEPRYRGIGPTPDATLTPG